MQNHRNLRRGGGVLAVLQILLLILIFGVIPSASYVIEYQWWGEMNQRETWFDMLFYKFAPATGAALLGFLVLWVAHARGMKFAGESLRNHPAYSRISTVVLFVVAVILAISSIDAWNVVLYAGSRNLPSGADTWLDPIFGKPLSFYLFALPFYNDFRSFLITLTVAAGLVYWLTARGWQLRYRLPDLRYGGEFDPSMLRLEGGLESRFLRGAGAFFLLMLAVRYFLGRYEMVWNSHSFMVGVDYVNDKVTLPLQWVVMASCVIAAALLLAGIWKGLIAVPAALLLQAVVPGIVGALYVRPNEIALERPYIEKHIESTRTAYGLNRRVKEIEFHAKPSKAIDTSKHQNLLDNVRLWDWRAFHDSVTQIQALRPYYTFADSDVDRYTINGDLRQVLLTPRELDINQLPDALSSWVNPHFIYTHGYGIVLAEVARITPDGLPVLLVKDAPPVISTPSLKITRPEIYYGEVVHEPIFANTAQSEFDYPSGDSNVQGRYQGKGGFPIDSFPLRLAAAVSQVDFNIILTNLIQPGSRMIIHRNIRARVNRLASFIQWDSDPYLVVNEAGRLVWTIDGYTTSRSHPYSQPVNIPGVGQINYIRNSVKATVDAYDGTTNFYVFDREDPLIAVWRNVFPNLFKDQSEMPPDLRTHARYPETIFRVQAEIYRTFHMRDPQAFYNKEDVWNIARTASAQAAEPRPMTPTYIVGTMPGSDSPEFLLLIPFTPRNKDNLIGLMLARCDGESLGEIVLLELSKQELIFGPMQIAARINQDQNIAKDLTLWNQQGSQSLRGQMLVLPIDDTFLYVEPIYIQATEARMPQLKKVVLAQADTLIYADTYGEALARLSGNARALATTALTTSTPTTSGQQAPAGTPLSGADARLQRIRDHLRRYRELTSQGKLAEAGRELEAIDAEAASSPQR